MTSISLFSSSFHLPSTPSRIPPNNYPSSSSFPTIKFNRRAHTFPPLQASIKHVHSYGTVDYEARSPLQWGPIYTQLTQMTGGPTATCSSVLESFEAEGQRIRKWALCRVIKQLRKFRHFHLALQVYEWMISQGDRFLFTSSDMAIQLDLISRVHGVSHAEEYFSALSDASKDRRTYCSLLNAYGKAKLKEKVEATMETMKAKGYAGDTLPYNVMMTLYLNVGENEKVNTVINEMKQRNVKLDIYSYNIWMTNCAAMEDEEEMERVFDMMTADSRINSNWTTFSTLATMYIKLGNFEKAERFLKEVEIRVTGRDRAPFNFLLGLYSSIGKREEVYRIWKWYKSSFPNILNWGYQLMIYSLIKLEDIEGAEAIYEEWLSIASRYDPKICNLLLSWYARQGEVEKARGVCDRFLEKGGKVRSSSWEILAEGYIRQKQISEALSYMKAAASEETPNTWRPRPENVANLLALCTEQDNSDGVDLLMDVLRSRGCLEKEEYKLLINS